MDAATNNFLTYFVHFTHCANSLKHTLQKCLHKLRENISSNFTIPVIAQDNNICLNITTLREKKPISDGSNNFKSTQKCHFSRE